MLNAKIKLKYFLLYVFVIVFLLSTYFYETLIYVHIDMPPSISIWREWYVSRPFMDEYGRVLILQKEGYAWSNDKYVFQTPDDVLAYFDEYLAEQKWTKTSNVAPDFRCEYLLLQLQNATELHFREYVNDRNQRVCVNVIPLEQASWEERKNYQVLLTSIRLSPLTEFLEVFRNW